MRQRVFRGLAISTVVATLTGAAPAANAQTVEWPAYAADQAGTKYSPLDQITPTHFGDLEIAWRWTSISTEVPRRRSESETRPVSVAASPIGALPSKPRGYGRGLRWGL